MARFKRSAGKNQAVVSRLEGVDAGFDREADVHVHLPGGGQPKDGLPAGVTIAVAVVSALTGLPVRGGPSGRRVAVDVSLTGELTLSGALAPAGGIRSKVLGACRAGMAGVILPVANKPDIADSFGNETPCGISVHYASTMDEVLELALPDVVVLVS